VVWGHDDGPFGLGVRSLGLAATLEIISEARRSGSSVARRIGNALVIVTAQKTEAGQ
jgi:hypothetical protein